MLFSGLREEHQRLYFDGYGITLFDHEQCASCPVKGVAPAPFQPRRPASHHRVPQASLARRRPMTTRRCPSSSATKGSTRRTWCAAPACVAAREEGGGALRQLPPLA